MELLNYNPPKGKKFQFTGGVMGFSLCQAPTRIGYDCIHSILMGLVEDIPQARPTSIGIELKMPGEICVGKDRHHGAQSFHVIKGQLAPVIPLDGDIFLANTLIQG